MLATLAACGKSNNTTSSASSGASGINVFSTDSSPLSFIGNYDLVGSAGFNCGASIQIISDCMGYKILNNNQRTEEFCHINQGEIRSSNVTLIGNQLKSIQTFSNDRPRSLIQKIPPIPPGISNNNLPPINRITKILTLGNDGILEKFVEINQKQFKCEYIRR